MKRIFITTECVADLPANYLNEYKDIELIYYDIKTDRGIFRDTKEITSLNVLEYMNGGKKVITSIIPSAYDYKQFFTEKLKSYDEILHVSVSSGISEAFENANTAKSRMGIDGERIHIIDSRHLSSGQGLITMEAVKCRDKGMDCKDIINHLIDYIPKVSTSFLANNADYLYYNQKVGENVMKICRMFSLHPVLAMIDGKLTLKRVYIGNYKKCAKRYMKNTLGRIENIDTTSGFITYAGCSEELLKHINVELANKIHFDNLYKCQASATVSCNCGPSTFGILFAKKEVK